MLSVIQHFFDIFDLQMPGKRSACGICCFFAYMYRGNTTRCGGNAAELKKMLFLSFFNTKYATFAVPKYFCKICSTEIRSVKNQ